MTKINIYTINVDGSERLFLENVETTTPTATGTELIAYAVSTTDAVDGYWDYSPVAATKQYFRLDANKEMAKALARAKDADLLVKTTGQFRRYAVINRSNGNGYTVEFAQGKGGQKLGRCSCPSKVLCNHIPGALALHLHVALTILDPEQDRITDRAVDAMRLIGTR